MPNQRYNKGAYYERKAIEELRENGFETLRTAGSHGIFDVIGIRHDMIRLIQSKASRKKHPLLSTYWKDIVGIMNTKVPDQNVFKELWVYGNRTQQKIWIMT